MKMYLKKINLVFVACLLGVLLLNGCTKSRPTPPNPPIVVDSSKADVPSGAADGVTFINGGKSAIFNLYAPGKKSVYVIGDFNNWQASATYKMKNSLDGMRWWVEVDNLDPTKEYAYQYVIDGTLKVADPYAHKILDPNNDKYISSSVYPNLKAYPAGQSGIVGVMQAQPAAYTWQAKNFVHPETKNLVVYELLVRDFVETHSYKTLMDTLDYVARLGVNAIELMPVNEFEGNDSWGYNSNFMLALDKYYGTPNDYKAFVDACHARGIAVIQDIVLEDQFGSSPMVQMYWNVAANQPAADNPWFNPTTMHPYGVGYQMNQEAAATKYYVKNVLKYWLQEYHIDGYRFDQSKAFTQVNSGSDVAAWGKYDASRIKNISEYYDYIKSIDPTAYLILEHFTEDKEEAVLAQKGMILWNNVNFNAAQATMSWNDAGGSWDLSRMFYDTHGFNTPYSLMTYVESHDEERIQFKNEAYGKETAGYSTKNLTTGLKRDAMLAAFLMSVPGPKMMWQFGERGYDVSIEDKATGGRLGQKPPHWEYMQNADRVALYDVYAKMIKLKVNNPVFTTTNFSYNLNGAVKWIQLLGSDGTSVEVVGNFDVAAQSISIKFPATGNWYDNISGNTLKVTATVMPMTLAPGEYHVYSNSQLK